MKRFNEDNLILEKNQYGALKEVVLFFGLQISLIIIKLFVFQNLSWYIIFFPIIFVVTLFVVLAVSAILCWKIDKFTLKK